MDECNTKNDEEHPHHSERRYFMDAPFNSTLFNNAKHWINKRKQFIKLVSTKLSRRGAVVKGVEHISTKWRGSESRRFYQPGFEFVKTPLLILNH